MIIERIEIANFRNYTKQAIEPHPKFNIFYGDNAQGKTNLIEAIYIVACFKSFKTNKLSETIRDGEKKAKILANVKSEINNKEIEIEINEKERLVAIDNKVTRSLLKYPDGLNAILFSPDELQIAKGPPSERRKLIDRAITNIWPNYLTISREYHKVLLNRNKLLQYQNNYNADLFEVYDQKLAEIGSKIVTSRVRYLKQIEEIYRNIFQSITQNNESYINYICPPEVNEAKDNKEEIREILKRSLKTTRQSDIKRKTTTIGPHTHDLEFLINEKSSKQFGSQGQIRAIMLAFKIAQSIDILNKTKESPIILLDDVSSELDEIRNKNLFKFINDIRCQIFITSCQGDFTLDTNKSKRYQIISGVIYG